jgi:CxxC motif-containing protein
MKGLICIICPIGCTLSIGENAENLSITGSKCQRGVVYAQEEIRAPKRTVTATCPIDGETNSAVRRVPVKTSSPCPREKISALLHDIYNTKIIIPVKMGDVVIANWMGEGFDIVATRSFEKPNLSVQNT